MSYLNLVRIATGQVGVRPGQVNMVSSDTLATITAVGYLNRNGNLFKDIALSPTDIIECIYSYNSVTHTGNIVWLQPSLNLGIITLSEIFNPLMKSGEQVAVAGGAAAQTVTDAFCKTTSGVVASWNDTTNAVSIQKVAAGNGSFVVTSSGDPGASHINYIISN